MGKSVKRGWIYFKEREPRFIDRVFEEMLKVLLEKEEVVQARLIEEVAKRLNSSWINVSPAVRRLLEKLPNVFRVERKGRVKYIRLTEEVIRKTINLNLISLPPKTRAKWLKRLKMNGPITDTILISEEFAEFHKTLPPSPATLYELFLPEEFKEMGEKMYMFSEIPVLLECLQFFAKRKDVWSKLPPDLRKIWIDVGEEEIELLTRYLRRFESVLKELSQ